MPAAGREHQDMTKRTPVLLDKFTLQIARFASNDGEGPDRLCRLRVEPEKGRVVATDGHRMFTAGLREGKCSGEAFSVPAKDANVAHFLLGKNGTVGATPSDLRNHDFALMFEDMDEDYPDADQVMPATEPTYRIRVNLHYMRELFEALAEWHPGRERGVVLEIHDHLSPIVVKGSAEGREYAALLMPMRL